MSIISQEIDNFFIVSFWVETVDAGGVDGHWAVDVDGQFGGYFAFFHQLVGGCRTSSWVRPTAKAGTMSFPFRL